MEESSINNYECILQKITIMKISLITKIFAFSSNFPFRFLYIVSKSKKLREKIEETLSGIDLDNNYLSKETVNYINNYKCAQKIYLSIIEKTIEQKILGFKINFPDLNKIPNINNKNKYENVVYNNLKEELYEKYNSLKIYCSDLKYKNRNNKWFLEKISDKNNKYFNNCSFIINDILSIEILINLLYQNNYLNFKNSLKVKKIKENDPKKLILGDENIKYILEYPRAIIIKEKFIYQLLKSNIDNFYICSFENHKRLYSIIYQSKNYYNNNTLYIKANQKYMNLTINKPNISLNEINMYLKEYESINAETLEFNNFSIENSLYDYLFNSSRYNMPNIININNASSKNISIKKYNTDLLVLNFEKDFFEIDLNYKEQIFHCSELINYINCSKHIINLYLYNFPIIYLKKIINPLIEFISIDNFFNLENDIIFCSKEINRNLSKLKKIKIRYSNFLETKEMIYIKRNNFIIEDSKINLKNSILTINDNNVNNINSHKIYEYIESFVGIDKFNFEIGTIQLYNKANNEIRINMYLNDNNNELNDNIINEADINILKYLNFDNLLIYGHILNGIKPLCYYIINEKDNNKDFIEEFELIKNNTDILDIINKSNNNFSESNFSLILKEDYFFFPFVENLLLKISLKKLQKLLNNCVYGQEINVYAINMDTFYNIKNEKLKKLNIYCIYYKYGFNDIEYNLRYIYYNIPSLKCISINLDKTSIIFDKQILPLLCFKMKYKAFNNNIYFKKKILLLEFGDNKEIMNKMKDNNIINVNTKNGVIFKFNNDEIFMINDKNIIHQLQVKNKLLGILTFFYILTLFIILYIILKYILF